MCVYVCVKGKRGVGREISLWMDKFTELACLEGREWTEYSPVK